MLGAGQHEHRSGAHALLAPCFSFPPRPSLSRWKDLFVPFEGRGLTKANAKEKNKKLLCRRMDDFFLSVSNLASTFISLG